MKGILHFVVRNLHSQGIRTYLTVIGVVIGIAAIVAFMSIGKGMEVAVEREFERIGSDKIFLIPGSPNTLGFSGAGMVSSKFKEQDIRTIRSVQCVENVVGYFSAAAEVEFAGEGQTLIVYGIPIDENLDLIKSMKVHFVEQGRDLRRGDRKVAVIGKKVSESIFRKPIRLRDKILINSTAYRVVGILKATGGPDDYAVSIPLDDARTLGFRDEYTFIIVDVRDGCDASRTRDRIVDKLKRERGKEDFKAQTSDNLLSAFQSVLSIIRAIFVGVSAISLLVGGVGIMNTMLMAVIERTREIGVMKAVGAKKRDIMLVFLLESALIGMAGGIAGILLGLAISYASSFIINNVLSIEFGMAIPWPGILLSLAVAMLVGIFSGLYPAMRAADMDPVEALRWE